MNAQVIDFSNDHPAFTDDEAFAAIDPVGPITSFASRSSVGDLFVVKFVTKAKAHSFGPMALNRTVVQNLYEALVAHGVDSIVPVRRR
jgi:hypothetical protein